MDKKCLECQNTLICKFASNFEKINSKVNAALKDVVKEGDADFVKVEVNCQFFTKHITSLTRGRNDLANKSDAEEVNISNPGETYIRSE